jgi:hypothetical protein
MSEKTVMRKQSKSTVLGWGLALLVLLATTGQASAMTISMSGLAAKAEVTEQVTVNVGLDTGPGLTGITLLSIGVIFSDSQLAYRQDLSSTSSYALYGGRGAYLNASTLCGGPFGSPTAGSGCALRVGTTNQVNVDFISTDLIGGTDYTSDTLGVAHLATLVFDVIAVGDGLAEVDLIFTGPGNVISLAGGAEWTADLVGGGAIAVPEPGTALMLAGGLLGLGWNGRRRV